MDNGLPAGFRLGVAEAAFKKPGRNDLALLLSDRPAAAAGLFTTNKFQAAPVLAGRERLRVSPTARAVLINAGQANACTGEEGMFRCRQSREMTASLLGISPDDILPASTGVIGAQMDMRAWERALPALAGNLGRAGLEDFASAIMTTDAFPKYARRKLCIGNENPVGIAGAAKGAGMICPDMATMLAVVFCDAVMDPGEWRSLLAGAVDASFNRVSVDGDTSTNDTLYGLANGASGVSISGTRTAILGKVLTEVLEELAYMLVKDGEGATKVMHIDVVGAANDADAERAARAVGGSQLVKTAMYGKDANWGRVICALGRSGAAFNPDDVVFVLCGVELFSNGKPAPPHYEDLLTPALAQRDIRMELRLGYGPGKYKLLASDLTHDYVSVNSDYRS
ncbi:MAG: bifunctional glutamate N-acetyltransferase/amino-acid acetyltransferase ArgJ [Desulfovibrio sp.]|jgi:glutamate N-acetyltransferase/amino-acid N-acetyltransferase|nr:bifunctional glutamate N-acetyltransferase/amino-acid acetyltransferase ArgJ [Desulfovibrio sp.]